ncbi:MAG: 5'-methylthioadenosine nucleosidase [Pseudomonadota bacterium]
MSDDLMIFVALEDECPASLIAPHEVVYTGVGKVNAAIAAAEALARRRPKLAVNFGTAGAVAPGLGGLIECGAAVQRDMDLRPLGFALGETFGDPPPHEERWGDGPVVGTGDSFAAERPELACDLVDMEAFALARACRRAGAAFRCVKYVSDAADGAAAEDWDANKARGAALFAQWLHALRD